MGPFMCFETIACGEGPLAVAANKRLFSCVDPLVYLLHKVCSDESLLSVSVCPVHVQCHYILKFSKNDLVCMKKLKFQNSKIKSQENFSSDLP